MQSFLVIRRRRYIKYALVLAAIVFSILTYILLRSGNSILNSNFIFVLVYLDVILIFIAAFLIYQHIKSILANKKQNQNSGIFRRQITILFSCVTILPAICVFVFSMLFFNIGIENLFKSPVKNVIENAQQVSEIYINDMRINLENLTNSLAFQLGQCIDGFAIDQLKMNEILIDGTDGSKVDALIIQAIGSNFVNVLVSTPFSLDAQLEGLPQSIFNLNGGETLSWEANESIMATTTVNKPLGIYLVASAPIDGVILNHKHKIKSAVTEYANMATQRSGIKVSFATLFLVVTLFLLAISIFMGIIFASKTLRPINKLITATKNVTAGDYNKPIKLEKTKTEFDILIETFNDMMSKLEQQKQQLIISNKQNAWRDIARKIAHEIKNPLTPIQLSAERLKNKYKKEITTSPEVFNSCIDTIIRQVRCIGNLVKEFSDFARMPAPKIERVEIIELINQVVFIQANAHKNIKFYQDYDRPEFYCNIDQAQINQVIMNVIQNSINAISENNPPAASFIGNILISFYAKNDMMYITIEDDGPGFSDSVVEKALEPYYTTRENGTGLGLAIVHKIISDHNGEVSLGRSERLQGAKVLFEIPYNNLTMKGE